MVIMVNRLSTDQRARIVSCLCEGRPRLVSVIRHPAYQASSRLASAGYVGGRLARRRKSVRSSGVMSLNGTSL